MHTARTFIPHTRTGKIIQAGSIDLLTWSDDWQKLNQQALQADDDAAVALWGERDEYEDAILSAPCANASAALAKVRILLHHAAPGSPFEDPMTHRVLTQLAGWLEQSST